MNVYFVDVGEIAVGEVLALVVGNHQIRLDFWKVEGERCRGTIEGGLRIVRVKTKEIR